MRNEAETKTPRPTANVTLAKFAVVGPIFIVAALIVYKGRASLVAIQQVRSTGLLSTHSNVVVFRDATGLLTAAERSLNYFIVIWPALLFGILIGAGVRAFLPKGWLSRILGAKTFRAQIAGGAAGAPLMLCSCCIAPVFDAVYQRSSRLGPSLAVMLASPSLNPAALILTAMLFAPKIAIMRLLMGISAVVLGGLTIDRSFRGTSFGARVEDGTEGILVGSRDATIAFFRSLLHVLTRVLPPLALGIVCSVLLTEYMPKDVFSSNGLATVAVLATASIAVPVALPTFFEIPLALGLLSAGAPPGAAVAMLFAGPVINLASLLALAKATNWKVSTALAAFVWAVAVVGGLVVGV